jgi:class 3 adenylate cyclase
LTEEQQRRIVGTGTTALVQQVSSDLARASANDAGTIEATGYGGEDVLAARRPVHVGGLGWGVVTQVAADEINAPIAAYVRNILFAMALFVVVVTFVVVRWSGRVMEPIRAIAARLRAVRLEGVPPPQEGDSLRGRSPDEYIDLADSIDEMLARLDDRRTAVAARAAERARLVGRFLPAAIAQRSEQTGGDVLDHVTNASVAVLVVEGLGELLHRSEGEEVRRLLATAIDEVDALALDFGLERVKVTGDRYHAVCGATRPYLDHAPRAVGFALAACDLVRDLADDRGHPLLVHAGVDTGSVSVGLAERAGLVYDTWGPAVSGAARLASTAPAGQVAVSAQVRRQLPQDFVLADDGGDGDGVVVAHRGLADGGAR